jgi:hypothetical protein
MVGEHLNEATITRLGSILECGNMLSHPDCRATIRCGSPSNFCQLDPDSILEALKLRTGRYQQNPIG